MSDQEILLIEDSLDMIQAISALCDSEIGLRLVSEKNGKKGLEAALMKPYALVIIDVNLPSKSGFEICKALRKDRPQQPIMLLTGRREEIDKVLGLELGADDYVTKPFSSRELVARIRALLRRGSLSQPEQVLATLIQIHDLKIDTVGRRVWKGEKLLSLTRSEYEILELLASNPGRTFDRQELINLVLGYTSGTHDDVLSVHISRLRGKIENLPENPKYLITVRGVGYRFAAIDELENEKTSD